MNCDTAAAQTTSTSINGVVLTRMREQTEVRQAQDDWTGITDSSKRRKLQNRLSQRRYRRARADPNQPPKLQARLQSAEHPSSDTIRMARREFYSKFRGLIHAVVSSGSTDVLVKRQGDIGISATVISHLTDEFENIVLQHFLRADMLFTLIQFNVFRALLSNTKSLGWDFQWLECGEPVSPWRTALLDSVPSCPASLQPTQTQRKIEHHPWLDP